jgi:hypothetical protein
MFGRLIWPVWPVWIDLDMCEVDRGPRGRTRRLGPSGGLGRACPGSARRSGDASTLSLTSYPFVCHRLDLSKSFDTPRQPIHGAYR